MIQTLPFDSDLFAYPVGKIIWEPDFEEASFLVDSDRFQLVYVFSETPIAFSSNLIRHVDTKLTFSKTIHNPQSSDEVTLLEKIQMKMDWPQLEEKLRLLALESGSFSRFNLDPRLQQGEFEQLYHLWIKKAIAGGNLLIAPDMAGMVTFELKESIAQIGLIAVHPDHRRKSWGRKLVLAAEKEAHRQGASAMLIPTQEANAPAVKLYTDLGYHLMDQTYIYHFWKG